MASAKQIAERTNRAKKPTGLVKINAENSKKESVAKKKRGTSRAKIPRGSDVLTPPQARFVELYLIDGNQTQAYIGAFGKNARNSVSRSSATHLMKIPKVVRAIEAKQKTLADRLGITQEFVLREMKAIASFNIADYIEVDDKGDVTINMKEMERAQAAAVGQISTKKYFDKQTGSTVTETSIKPYDKKGALEILGRYTGIKGFGSAQLEITTPDGPIQIEHIHTLTEDQLMAIVRGTPTPKTIEGGK